MGGAKKNNLILFIHGFTGSKETWTSTEYEKRIPKYLEENDEIKANFDIKYFNYFTKLSDLPDKKNWVFSYLKNKIKKKPYVKLEQNLSVNVIKDKLCSDIEFEHKRCNNIILVAHSMGGLVAKASILKFLKEGNNRISGFISLAVPHKGTNLALLGNLVLNNPNTKDLEALGVLINQLNDEWIDKKDELPDTLYCYGLNDLIVPPVSSVSYDARKKNSIATFHDHESILIPDGKEDSIVVATQDLILESLKPKPQTIAKIKTDAPIKVELVNPASTTIPKKLTKSLPLTSMDKIIGRRTELEKLRECLTDKRQVVVVNGLGGLGKTTLAQIYATQFFDTYHHIAWMTQTSDNFSLEFDSDASLLQNLDISIDVYKGLDLFHEVMRKMNALPDSPNLLIIDNASQSIEEIRNYLPSQPSWHILVTSRVELNGFEPIRLDFLSEEDAIALFQLHYPTNKFSNDELKTLVQSVELHTLTIEILAKTAMVQHLRFDQLMTAISSDARADIKINRPDTERVERVTSYLASIFSMSQLNEKEILILKQFTCLPHDYIPYEKLSKLFNPLPEGYASSLNDLVQNGWILEDNEAYKMHIIIQEVVKKQCEVTYCDLLSLIQNVLIVIDSDKVKSINQTLEWLVYSESLASSILTMAVLTSDEEKITDIVLNNMALTLKTLGYFEKANDYIVKAIGYAEKNYNSDNPSIAVRYTNYGLILIDLGKYIEAKEWLFKAMKLRERNLGDNHPDIAISYSNYGIVLQTLGEYEESKKWLKKSLLSHEKLFGDNTPHPDTSTSYSNYGTLLIKIEEYEEAKKWIFKAIRFDEKIYGKKHHSTAVSYSNYGTVLYKLELYLEAKDYFLQSLKINEKFYGTEHPVTSNNYSSYGLALSRVGKLNEAKEFLEKGLNLDIINLAIYHPNKAISYSNLATILISLQEFKKAKIYFQNAYEILLKSQGANHPDTIVIKENLDSLG
jgi:tetratricopeptide (TPR) repeat protein